MCIYVVSMYILYTVISNQLLIKPSRGASGALPMLLHAGGV